MIAVCVYYCSPYRHLTTLKHYGSVNNTCKEITGRQYLSASPQWDSHLSDSILFFSSTYLFLNFVPYRARHLRHSLAVYLKCLFLFTCDASYQLARVWISWLHCWWTCARNSWVLSQLPTSCPFRSRTTTGSRTKVTEWNSYPVTRMPNLEINRR